MKRTDFRKMIDQKLREMGYRPSSWYWQANPARLILIIDGIPKEVPIKANMRKEALAYELGRLQGWADYINVSRAETPIKSAFNGGVRQIDLEDAIARVSA